MVEIAALDFFLVQMYFGSTIILASLQIHHFWWAFFEISYWLSFYSFSKTDRSMHRLNIDKKLN